MTTIQPRAFFDPDLIAREDAIDRMTQSEILELELGKDPFRNFDSETKALAGYLGPTLTGIASSFVGKAGLNLGLEMASFLEARDGDKAFATPLNFGDRQPYPSTVNGGIAEAVGQWQHFNKNNIEGIAEDLSSIPPSQWSYILGADSYGEYQERLLRTKIYSPEFAAMGNMGGATVGFAADALALITTSLALEPLAFAATGTRAQFIAQGTQIGTRAAVPFWGRQVNIATEAAEAAATVSTFTNMGRYAALGVAEEVAIKMARYNLDPTYDPDFQTMAGDAVISGTLGFALGGWAGRGYANDLIETTANRYVQRARAGESTISMRSAFPFASTTAADARLIGDDVAPVGETVTEIANEAWTVYSVNRTEFVPNTQTMGLPMLQGSQTPAGATAAPQAAADIGVQTLRGMFRPANHGESSFTQGGSAFLRTILNRTERTPVPDEFAREVQALRNTSGVPDDVRGFRPAGIVMSNTRRSPQAFLQVADANGNQVPMLTRRITPDPIAEGVGGQGLDDAIEIEFDATRMYGRALTGPSAQADEARGLFNFQYGGSWSNLNRSVRSVMLRSNADAAEAQAVRSMMETRGWNRRVLDNGDEVFTPPRTPIFRTANERFRYAVEGIQSNILGIVAEIERRGGMVDAALTQQVARVLFEARRLNLRGEALQSHVWTQVRNLIDPAVMARIDETRRLGNQFRVQNLSADFDELVQREEFINGLWDIFEQGDDAAEALRRASGGGDTSLILQTMQEIRRRGGNLTREEFENVIEDLRQLMQNPPMRTNSRGARMLDSKARIAQLATIINRRTPLVTNQIYVPNYLRQTVANFQLPGAVAVGGSGGGGVGLRAAGAAAGTTPPPVNPQGTVAGAMQMQREIPHLTGPDTLGGVQQLFNQAANVLRSNNPLVRLFGFTGYNSRRAMNTPDGTMVAQGQTIFELGTYEMVGLLSRSILTYRNAYTRFALNRAPSDRIGMMDGLRAGFGRGARETRRRFDEALAVQIRTGAFNDPNAAVNEAARSMRQVLNDVHTLASNANVRGFQQGANLNYLSRMYRWGRIEQLARTPDGRTSLIQLMEQALGGAGGTRQLMLDDGTMVDLADVPAAARVLAERLISLATRSDNSPLLDIDQELADALDDILNNLRPAGASRTPYGRPRIILNEQATLAGTQDFLGLGRTELRFADLIADDVPLIMKRYLTSVMGAVNERRMLDELHAQIGHYGIIGPNNTPIQPFDTFDQYFDLVNRIGTQVHGMGGVTDAGTLASMREIVSALRYEPLHRSNSELGSLARFGDNVLSVMLPLSYMATGGAFALAATTETSRIVGTLGMKSTLKQMPVIREMVENWQSMDEGPRNFSMMVDQAFHPSTDRLRRALFYDIENQIRGENPNPFISGLNSVSNFFSDVTLLSPVTSFTQHLAAAASIQHLFDVARNTATRLDDPTIRTLGLEPAQYDQMIQWLGNNAITHSRGGAERVIDIRNMHGPEFDNLRVFIDRFVRTRVQDIPTRGDFGRWAFSFFGRLMTQFRTFNLKGVDNFMLQNISRARRGGSMNVTKEIAATMVFGGLIQYARQYMNYESALSNGNYTESERIKNDFLGVKGFVKGSFTGPSEFFLPIMAVDATWNTFVSDEPLMSPYRYSGLQWYSFPAQSFISKSYEVGRDVYGATVARALGVEEREREITKGTLHKARMLIPASTMPGLKQFFDIAETEIAAEFELAKQQPRKP